MKQEFWLDKWQKNETGFHLPEVHPLLKMYVNKLAPENQQVLVPLCGKSLDISYLASSAAKVAGVELSDRAIKDFYSQLSQEPVIINKAAHRIFQHANVLLYQGDFFTLPEDDSFDVVYDRAALIALPGEMRSQYVEKVASLCHKGSRLLLISLTYASDGGPPFSIPDEQVRKLYEPYFSMEKLGEYSADVKGQPATEVVWYSERLE